MSSSFSSQKAYVISFCFSFLKRYSLSFAAFTSSKSFSVQVFRTHSWETHDDRTKSKHPSQKNILVQNTIIPSIILKCTPSIDRLGRVSTSRTRAFSESKFTFSKNLQWKFFLLLINRYYGIYKKFVCSDIKRRCRIKCGMTVL